MEEASLAGSIFFLNIPADEKTRKICGLLTDLGAKVLNDFDVNMITHLVVSSLPEASTVSAVTPVSRKRAAKMVMSALNRNGQHSGSHLSERDNLVSIASLNKKNVWTLVKLVKVLNTLSKKKQEETNFGRRGDIGVDNEIVVEDLLNSYKSIKKDFCLKANIPQIHFGEAPFSPFLNPRELALNRRQEKMCTEIQLNHVESSRQSLHQLPQRSMQMKRKASYCEICHVTYLDLEEHINSESHRDFASDDNHYKEIDILLKLFDA